MIENPMAVSAGAESAPSSIELAPYANAVVGGAHVASTPDDGSDRRTVAVAVAFSTSTKSRDRAKGFPALSSQRARQLDPAYVKAWYREGCALTELGDFESAALAFFEGMQIDGDNGELKRGFDEAIRRGRNANKTSREK